MTNLTIHDHFLRQGKRFAMTSLTVMLGTTMAHTSQARDNSRFEINQNFVSDSNPRNLSEGDDSIFGSETRLSYILDRETPISALETLLSISRNQFNDSDYNTTNYSLRSGYERNSLRWTAGFDGSVLYDTTREQNTTNLGILTEVNRRFTWTFGPRLQYKINPRTSIALNTQWLERFYKSDNLVDYRVITASPTLLYDVSPLQNISFALRYRSFNTLESDQSVDSIGPSVGWSYNFHPQYSLSLNAGALASKFSGYENDGTEVNPIYEARLNYIGERNKANIGITRSRDAYPNGTEYDLTSVAAENEYTINPLWAFNAGISYRMTEQPNFTTDDLGHTWQQTTQLNYAPAEQWNVSLSQQYNFEELESGENSDRHIFKLNLGYSFGGPKQEVRN